MVVVVVVVVAVDVAVDVVVVAVVVVHVLGSLRLGPAECAKRLEINF